MRYFRTYEIRKIISGQQRYHSGLFGTCVFDDQRDRALTGYSFHSEIMTLEMCLSACREKNFTYAGLQWQIECYCGSEPEQGFEWSWTHKCNERCPGNVNQVCGGTNAMSVYTTQTNFDGICIYNFPSPRQILGEFSITGHRNMTIEKCSDICQG